MQHSPLSSDPVGVRIQARTRFLFDVSYEFQLEPFNNSTLLNSNRVAPLPAVKVVTDQEMGTDTVG